MIRTAIDHSGGRYAADRVGGISAAAEGCARAARGDEVSR